jgi:hypothetical protein
MTRAQGNASHEARKGMRREVLINGAVPAAALFQIAVDEFYLRPRKPDYAAIDREAAALIEGKN